MRQIYVKRKMLYTLLVPYLLVGISAAVFFGYRYNSAVKGMREKYYDDSCAIINKVSREVDYLVSDMENLAVEVELNEKLLKPLSIPGEGRSGEDNYTIAMALRELRSIKKFNHLIEDVLLYYRTGDFFLNPRSIRTEQGIYEDYGGSETAGYEAWKGQLTGFFPQGQLLTVDHAIFYIITVPFQDETENCNIIIKVNTPGFLELLNDYNLLNEHAVSVYSRDMALIASNDMGESVVLSNTVKAEIQDHVQNGIFGRKIIEIDGTAYDGIYKESPGTDLITVFLADQRVLNSQIRFLTAVYLGGGLLGGLLLFLGIYGISLNYRSMLSVIERLKKNSTKETELPYSEFDYINNALNHLEQKMSLQEDAVFDHYIRKTLYGLLDEDDDHDNNFLQSRESLCEGQSIIAIFESCLDVPWDVKEAKLNQFIIGNVLKDIFETDMECFTLSVYQWEIVILNWCGKGRLEAGCVEEGLEKLRRFLHDRLDLPYTIGISNQVTGLKEFAKGYRQAMEALEGKQVLGDCRVIPYGQLKEGGHPFEYTETMDKQFQNYIRLGDFEKAVDCLEEIYHKAFYQSPISPESGKMLLLHLIKSVNEVSKEMGSALAVDALAVLKKNYTAQGMKSRIQDVIYGLCEMSREQVDSAERRHHQIRQYIARHYGDADLSVAMIAEEFHLNASYLSRFFKEETGENLLNYINQYRVEKAKELLLDDGETVAAVAEKTGFFNAAALSRTFKKIEGITPGQYRGIHQSGRR